MRTLLPTLALVALFTVSGRARSVVPDTGKAAIHHQALELGAGTRVLSMAIRPGHEDLATLATLRFGHGARIVCVFVTNGESGECDDADRSPAGVAVARREAATEALRTLDAGVIFWNFPDIAAAPTRDYALARWDPDTLLHRARALILQYRPDMILIHRDPETSGGASLPALMGEMVLAVCDSLRPEKSGRGGRTRAANETWEVARIWRETTDGNGVTARSSNRHPVLRRTYAGLAETAAGAYHQFSVQRKEWIRRADGGNYRALHPAGVAPKTSGRSLTDGLPGPPAATLGSLDRAIRNLSRSLAGNPRSSTAVLRRVAALIDSVDMRLPFVLATAGRERRTLLDWKESLENLRTAVLGVSVQWTAMETTLTERQLAFVRIDTVTGPIGRGTTELYVPGTGQGWILNEQLSPRLPLQFSEPYRLVSPGEVAYDLPAAVEFGKRATVFQPLILYIIHKGEAREENFLKRFDVPVRFAPRFTAEVLTPIVRCMPGAEVRVRLTNNTRDGVADAIRIDDTLAVFSSAPFRLSTKGSSADVALPLGCSGAFPDGEAVLPLRIGNYQVSAFLARQAVINVLEEKRIGVITGKSPAQVPQSLRDAGFVRVLRLDSAAVAGGALDTLEAVVLDRRAYALVSWLGAVEAALRRFVSRGGHLVLLAQDDTSWPVNLPVTDQLRPTRVATPPESPTVWDSLHAFLRAPNDLRGGAIHQPVFRSAWQRITLRDGAEIDIVARSAAGDPLLVTGRAGAGRVTYAAAELVPQWMSIQPGALRLLANMLSQ